MEIIIPAASALLGVIVGGLITCHNQRRERQHNRIREQLQGFYSPLFGMRAQILAKSEVRLKVSGAADAAWRALVSPVRGSPGAARKLEQEKFPDFAKILQENDRLLIEEILPLYRQMVEHFSAHMWLAEPSTLDHFGALVEFVEIWDRWLKKTLPAEVVTALGHSEKKLQTFYEDVATQLTRLRERLNR